MPAKKHKVAVIGSGNWGTTIAKIVAENTAIHPELFEKNVEMWVFEEKYQLPKDSPHASSDIASSEQPLSKLINHFHENVKYLPDIKLPENLHANSDIKDAVKDSTILIFNLPHQFIDKTCDDLVGNVASYARGISCIKGVSVSESGISLFSDVIAQRLNIYCGALSGANVALEVAKEKFCETTIAYDPPRIDLGSTEESSSGKQSLDLKRLPGEYPLIDGSILKQLFHRPYFHVRVTSDVTATSLAGALKNIVALAAGFVIGMGWGDNAKAAIMRVGLLEMIKFAKRFFPGKGVKETTFTEESAGVADLITSCSSGRNFRCAKMATEEGKNVQEIERRELNGQILQGVGTSEEVYKFLHARKLEKEFPLFTAVHQIVQGHKMPQDLPMLIEGEGKIESRSGAAAARL